MVYCEQMDKTAEVLDRGVANIIPSKPELEKALTSGKKLNIYLGIDPTATRIHLGHAVTLRKLQAFADLGHNVTFLIGDFTSLIGDTSDKNAERPILTKEEIQKNFQTYKKQAEKILDFSKVKVRNNSEWLSKLSFEDIVKLCQHFSVGDFISRELIRRRLDDGKRVALHEVLYPVMQGYDSYFMDTDLQIGGTDQTFNMQAGRTLQKDLRGKESFVLTTEFLMGTDGQKMSKTSGNAIWLEDAPNDMYAKVMAIDDSVIEEYYVLGTNAPMSEIAKITEELAEAENPMPIKKKLANHIVTEFHGADAAQEAQENFEKTVQKKELPTEIPIVKIPYLESLGTIDIIDLLTEYNLVTSRSEAKNLIKSKGVRINGKVIDSLLEKIPAKKGTLVQIGRRNWKLEG